MKLYKDLLYLCIIFSGLFYCTEEIVSKNKEKRTTQEQVFLWVGGVLTTSLLSYFIYKIYKNTKKINNKNEKLNSQLPKQEEQNSIFVMEVQQNDNLLYFHSLTPQEYDLYKKNKQTFKFVKIQDQKVNGESAHGEFIYEDETIRDQWDELNKLINMSNIKIIESIQLEEYGIDKKTNLGYLPNYQAFSYIDDGNKRKVKLFIRKDCKTPLN